MQGWIKLHRKITDHDIWNDVTTFRLFTLLLTKASHRDGLKVSGYTLNRGQYLRSYTKLMEDLSYKEGRGLKKVSKSTVSRSVNKLIENGMVTVHETELGTVFTVCKYHLYQGFDTNNDTERETVSGTNLEPSPNELGTNLEPYQELKNLREEEGMNSSEESPFNLISNKFIQRRARGFDLSPIDEESIKRVLQDSIPVQQVLKWIDEIFDEYEPKHRLDYIKHFTYCEKGILVRKAKQEERKSKVKEFPRVSKTEANIAAIENYFNSQFKEG